MGARPHRRGTNVKRLPRTPVSQRPYCTGVSVKRQEYCLLSIAISRVFTFPMRSTDRLFAPTGRAKVVFTEPSDPTGAENSPPVLGFTESSVPVSARSKNRCETSASLQAGGEPTSRAGFARQDSASTDGAAAITPSATRDASVRILNSNSGKNQTTGQSRHRAPGSIRKHRRHCQVMSDPSGQIPATSFRPDI
jgi:hypothetical protein